MTAGTFSAILQDFRSRQMESHVSFLAIPDIQPVNLWLQRLSYKGHSNWAGNCFAQNGVIIYPNAFGTFGNMGRNILRGPHFVNWDFSPTKLWRLNERLSLQLRGDFFNILNHANFASPSGNLVSRHMGELRTTPDVAASN